MSNHMLFRCILPRHRTNSVLQLSLLVLLSMVELVRSQQRSYGCYPEFSSQHSGCIASSKCQDQVLSGVSVAQKLQIVELHNEIRAIAAKAGPSRSSPGAADMLEMQWDDELAFIAQKWADQCIRSTDCGDCRRISRFPVGQNVFFYEFSPDQNLGGANWSKPFASWSSLKRPLDSSVTLSYNHSGDYAAYTQLTWAQSYLVGCGFAKQLKGSRGYYTYVCNYGPTGNIQGMPVYSVGRPCSQCPSGYEFCLYEALCRQGQNQPTTTTPAPYYNTPSSSTTTTTSTARPTPSPSPVPVPVPVQQYCRSQCVPEQYIHLCDTRTIVFGTSCSANRGICCSLALIQSPIPPTTTSTTTTTTTVPPPRQCRYDCVQYVLRDFCERGTVDFGRTTCSLGEICCRTKAPMTTTSTTTTTTTTTTPRPVVTTPAGPPCQGEFTCVAKSAIHDKCDVRRLTEFLVSKPVSTLGVCPSDEVCCPRKKKVTCPPTHVCLPMSSESLCLVGSTIQATDSDCNSGEKICCQLDTSLLEKSTQSPEPKACQDACLSGLDAALCIQSDLAIPDAMCPNGGTCCRFGGPAVVLPPFVDRSKTPLSTNSVVDDTAVVAVEPVAPMEVDDGNDDDLLKAAPPLPCDGYGKCMARYLASVCQNEGDVPQRFSDLFVCTNPRLRCCVSKSVIERRKVALRGANDSDTPKSPLTRSACGKRAPKVQLARNADKFCWMVDIVDANNEVQCHGALVELQFISTAASCALDDMNVRRLFVKFPWRQEKYAIVTHLAHYEFDPQTLDSDLNVLRLSEQIDLDVTGACLLCIPETKSKKDIALFAYSTMAQDRSFGSKIHQTPTTIGDQETCQRAGLYDETGLGPKNSVCMRYGTNWCGEKGAPLVFSRDGLSWLAGHLSFPTGECLKAGGLGMYTDTLGKWAVDFFKNTLRALGTGVLVAKPSTKLVPMQGGRPVDADGKTCGALLAVPNGSFRIVSCEDVQAINLIPLSAGRNVTQCLVDGSRYPVGTRVNYECNEFYDLHGSAWRACEADGNWNGISPICQPVCGRRSLQVGLTSRGQKSNPGEWPWVAALYSTSYKQIVCAGALIRKDWVLTAAHCVVNPDTQRVVAPKDLTVHLGKTSRSFAKDDELVQRREVTRIIAHPQFSTETYDSDVALLRLSSPAVLNERVQLICLPRRYDISERNLNSGRNGTVAGWGLNEFGKQSEDLAHIQLPVVPMAKCREDTVKSLGDSAATRFLNANMYCAGHGPNTSIKDYQSVCEGDSGGPMVFQEKDGSGDAWQVEGIVSFYVGGSSCQDRKPGMYSIFTRVINFQQWIDANAV